MVPAVGPAREQIKRPAVLGARQAGAEDDAEIFNVERDAARERIRRVRTLLDSVSPGLFLADEWVLN